ncbi:MAG: xanthine dehydrogenase family protein subunit M [Anaerolineales bacterium]|nr:xanthine dehydrogenase family protein subunit M [Anaerolineales bacterium]
MRQAQPGLPVFDYVCPESFQDAYTSLADGERHAVPFSGGTDIFVQMRDGAKKPQLLVDIKKLPGIMDITEKTTSLRIGAAATLNSIAALPVVRERLPMLVEAVDAIASYQLRNRATIGGNLCNASPAADMAPSMLVLEADLIISGPEGERRLPITKFFHGPGQQDLRPGEILQAVEVSYPPDGSMGTYHKLGRNASGDLAIVGVAGLMLPDSRKPAAFEVRLALASVAPTPLRVPAAEALLSEKGLEPDVIQRAADLTMEAAKPIDDTRASAAYREAMVRSLTVKVLERLAAEKMEAGL